MKKRLSRGLSVKEEKEIYDLALGINKFFAKRGPKRWQAMYAMIAVIAAIIADEADSVKDAAERAELISDLLHQETETSLSLH